MNLFKIGSALDGFKKNAAASFEHLKQKLAGPQAFWTKASPKLFAMAIKLGPWLLKKAVADNVITQAEADEVLVLEKEAEQFAPVVAEVEQELAALAGEAAKVAQ